MKLSAEGFEQIVSGLRADAKLGARTYEQRRNPRVGVGMTVTVLSSAEKKRAEMRIRDLSADGIGLTHDEPKPLGSLLCLILERSTGDLVKAIYMIVRCQQVSDSQYVIGCQLKLVVEGASSEAA